VSVAYIQPSVTIYCSKLQQQLASLYIVLITWHLLSATHFVQQFSKAPSLAVFTSRLMTH